MKKTIRVLSVASVVIYGLSFFLLLLVILLQTALAPLIVKNTEQIFVVPAGYVVNGVFMLGISLLAMLLYNSEKAGLWVNILLMGVAVLVISPLYTAIGTAQSTIIGQTQGSIGVISLSYVNILAGYTTMLNPLGNALFLVSGGMSITYKSMSKKLQKAL